MAKPTEPKPMLGLPTVYRGVTFRARIEAVWAAYFDVLGFEWEYEPNGEKTFPDFRVAGQTLEVKGALHRGNFDEHRDGEEARRRNPDIIAGAGANVWGGQERLNMWMKDPASGAWRSYMWEANRLGDWQRAEAMVDVASKGKRRRKSVDHV